jgi:hypothetical protein
MEDHQGGGQVSVHQPWRGESISAQGDHLLQQDMLDPRRMASVTGRTVLGCGHQSPSVDFAERASAIMTVATVTSFSEAKSGRSTVMTGSSSFAMILKNVE